MDPGVEPAVDLAAVLLVLAGQYPREAKSAVDLVAVPVVLAVEDVAREGRIEGSPSMLERQIAQGLGIFYLCLRKRLVLLKLRKRNSTTPSPSRTRRCKVQTPFHHDDSPSFAKSIVVTAYIAV